MSSRRHCQTFDFIVGLSLKQIKSIFRSVFVDSRSLVGSPSGSLSPVSTVYTASFNIISGSRRILVGSAAEEFVSCVNALLDGISHQEFLPTKEDIEILSCLVTPDQVDLEGELLDISSRPQGIHLALWLDA